MKTKGLAAALILSWACAAALAASPAPGRQAVRFGLFDTFSPQFYAETVEPTLSYLAQKLPGYSFEIKYLEAADAERSLSDGSVDFFIAPSGIYGILIHSVGIRHIATRRCLPGQDPSRSVASAFIVRSDRTDLRTIADLRGRTVAASQPLDFEGWQIAMGELAQSGYNWRRFFKSVNFIHYQMPDVVAEVLAGGSDAGVIRACGLEQLESEGWVEKGTLRVVGDKAGPGASCRRSTGLYPDAVIGSLERANPDVVRDVTVALLTMPAASGGWDWSVSSDFLALDRLYRSLEIGPYAYLRDRGWRALWQRHREKILPLAALLLLLIAYEARLHYLVRVRTRDLTEALRAKDAAEADARHSRERLTNLERAGVISQLSSMIAHELKQPLASISNYASGLEERWRRAGGPPGRLEQMAVDSIRDEAGRAAQIVDRVRAYAKNQVGPMGLVDFSETVKKAIRTYERNAAAPVELGSEIEAGITVLGHGLELELLALNLIRNAGQAAAKQPHPSVTVILRRDGPKAELQVLDNGPRVSDSDLRRLTEISESVKPGGLGLGLAIVRDIADRHGASLRFERMDPCGLRVTVHLKREPDKGEKS